MLDNSMRRIAVGLAALVIASFGTPTSANAAETTITPVGRAAAGTARVVSVPSAPHSATPSKPATVRAAAPNAVPVVTQFDGATGQNCSFCGRPSDVNTAVGRTQIAEATNVNVDVYTKTGGQVCHFAYNTLLSTSDNLTDPRIVYDNVFGRFVTVVTVVPPNNSVAPQAIWVLASTQAENACGSWFAFRVVLNSAAAPLGQVLDFPYAALDFDSILMEGNTSRGGRVWAIPKSAAYNGNSFSVSVFPADIDAAPVTNSGIPMRRVDNTYFLAAIPGSGYNLYRMTNSSGPNTTFALQATISSPFNRPRRNANQPGTTATLDASVGVIVWPPAMAVDNRVWFAHGVDAGGFPTIRYGAVNVNTNTVQTALAFHGAVTDDFNPSISIGDNFVDGTTTVFLNWAFTDASHVIATTPTVDTFVLAPGASPQARLGADTPLVTGSSSDQVRFGDLSSVTIDPTAITGSCAVTGQQYFGTDWNTRIARIGTC